MERHFLETLEEKEKREFKNKRQREWCKIPGNRAKASATVKKWRQKTDYYKRYYEEIKKPKMLWLKEYGLTKESFFELLASQNNKCAICGSEKPNRKNARYLSVDHDEKTKIIRGLLCSKCNFGLGQFNHDINLLLKAVEYLKGFELKITK